MIELSKTSESDIRTRIMKAALELFANESYHAVSVPRIAKKANVGIGSIYRMAPSKSALAELVFDYATKILYDYVLLPVEIEEGMTNEDFFWVYWKRLVKWVLTHPESIKFIVLYNFVGPEEVRSKPQFLSAIEIIVEIADSLEWLRDPKFEVVCSTIAGPLMFQALNDMLDEDSLMATGEAVMRALRPDNSPVPAVRAS